MNTVEENAVNLAKKWLLYSGIQNNNSTDKFAIGGVNSWLNLDTRKYDYIYTEITGYAMTTFLYLNSLSEERLLIDNAMLCADWVKNSALQTCGGVKTRYYLDAKNEESHYSFNSNITYAFDDGMVLFGLACLYKKTHDKNVLDTARKIADFLVGTMQKTDGSFYASYDPVNKNLEDDDRKWSTQSGSYHAKIAIGLLLMHELTKDERYKLGAIKVCDYSLTRQEKDGRFITFRDTNGTNLHPHCYSAEGLFYVGMKLNNKKYIQAASFAATWALEQLKDNKFPCIIDPIKGNNYNTRSDTVAQTMRIGLIANQLGKLDDEHVNKIKAMSKILLKHQYSQVAKEDNQEGGFFYGNQEDGSKLNHLNSWCTMFALQALSMFDEYFNKNRKIDFELLV